jgi:hypothetical protein
MVLDALGKFFEKRLLALSSLSVRPSVCPHGTIGNPLDRLLFNFVFVYFLKIFRKNTTLIKIWQERRIHYMETYINLWHLAEFFLERVMFLTKLWRKSEHILCSIYFFFQKACRLWDNFVKYSRVREVTGGSKTRRRKDMICNPDN